MKPIKYILSLLFFALSFSSAFAQQASGNDDVVMADALRQSGKIYVVVACLLLIFAGIIVFLILLERKTSRLEKRLAQSVER